MAVATPKIAPVTVVSGQSTVTSTSGAASVFDLSGLVTLENTLASIVAQNTAGQLKLTGGQTFAVNLGPLGGGVVSLTMGQLNTRLKALVAMCDQFAG
jgi:hypothetical protein